MGRDSSLIFDHMMLVQTLHVFATIVFAYNTSWFAFYAPDRGSTHRLYLEQWQFLFIHWFSVCNDTHIHCGS